MCAHSTYAAAVKVQRPVPLSGSKRATAGICHAEQGGTVVSRQGELEARIDPIEVVSRPRVPHLSMVEQPYLIGAGAVGRPTRRPRSVRETVYTSGSILPSHWLQIRTQGSF